MSEAFNEYIQCYTNNKDNTKCCEANGVAKAGKHCLDFCKPGNHTASWKHLLCKNVEPAIIKCNQEAQNKITTTF